ASTFLDYFSSSPPQPYEATVLNIPGRMYPVEIAYLSEPTEDYVREAVKVVWDLHLKGGSRGSGDVLVFLTGREEIEMALYQLPPKAPRLSVVPLHAGLSTADQLQVFQATEPDTRKVVISTNIAEASVTIDGIRFVVDSGFVKQLPKSTSPELTRVDLATPILQLKSLGIDDLMKFEWVSAPPSESVLRALELLVNAGMISQQDGRLTEIGSKVAEVPVEIGVARMLWASKEHNCGEEILTIAAMVAVQDVFIIPDGSAGALAELERRKFTAEEG
ncbi:9616_t:CDS:2, partial [Acaulospora colombiana]